MYLTKKKKKLYNLGYNLINQISKRKYTNYSIVIINMGNLNEKVEAASTATVVEQAEPKRLKPCCACPETKKVRDACIIENGEENCKHLIEAHKDCMRKLGFNI